MGGSRERIAIERMSCAESNASFAPNQSRIAKVGKLPTCLRRRSLTPGAPAHGPCRHRGLTFATAALLSVSLQMNSLRPRLETARAFAVDWLRRLIAAAR